MKLAGFNFTKINVEKGTKERPKDLKINTNIEILDITTKKSSFLKAKETFLVIQFSHMIEYGQGFAKIELSGNVALVLDSKMGKDILKEWKQKKMPVDFKIDLFNLILNKTNIRALPLEEEMNLPYHIPLPSLKHPGKEGKK